MTVQPPWGPDHILVPPSLLYSMARNLGGSFTATPGDLGTYDSNKHSIEINRFRDPFALQIKIVNLEDLCSEIGHKWNDWLYDHSNLSVSRVCGVCSTKEIKDTTTGRMRRP